jgi:hypothetical protein
MSFAAPLSSIPCSDPPGFACSWLFRKRRQGLLSIARGQPTPSGRVFPVSFPVRREFARISSIRGRLSWADQNKQERRMSQGSTASHYRLRTSCHGRELCSSCSAQLDWNFEPVHEQLLVWRNAFALEIHVGEIRFG